MGTEGTLTLAAAYLWGASAADALFLASLYGAGGPPGLPPFYPSPGKGEAPPGDGALLAGLPPSFREEGGRLPAKGAARAAAVRRLLADDFLEALLAFEGFGRALQDRADPAELGAWCRRSGLDYPAVVLAAQKREALFADVLAAGLNPFWGHERRLAAAATPAAFAEAARRLKRCLFAGLRPRLLEYDAAANAYRGRHGELVAPPPAFTDAALAAAAAAAEGGGREKPRRLVTDRVAIRKAPAAAGAPPLLYRLAPGLVSVLDGAVPDDAAAWEPRRGAARLY